MPSVRRPMGRTSAISAPRTSDDAAKAPQPAASSPIMPAGGPSGGTRPAVDGRSGGDRLRLVDARLGGEEGGLVGPLPRQVEVRPAEVAVRRGLAVERPAQV